MRRRGTKWLLLALVVLGVVGVVAVELDERFNRRGTADVARLPRDVVAVARFDAARMRDFEPASRLRAWWSARPAGRAYAARVRACGFDPLERADAVTWALDAGTGQLGPVEPLVVLEGRGLRAEDQVRCLEGLARAEPALGVRPAGTVDSRLAFDVGASRYAVLDHGAVAAHGAYLPRALEAVADQRAPTLASDAPVRVALAALGGEPVQAFALDLRALPALARAHTAPSNDAVATALGDALTVAYGMWVERDGGARVAYAVRFASADAADRGAARLDALWSRWSPLARPLAQALELACLDHLRSTPVAGVDPAAAQRGFALLNHGLESFALRRVADAARYDATLSPDEVNALESAARASLACAEADVAPPSLPALPTL